MRFLAKSFLEDNFRATGHLTHRPSGKLALSPFGKSSAPLSSVPRHVKTRSSFRVPKLEPANRGSPAIRERSHLHTGLSNDTQISGPRRSGHLLDLPNQSGRCWWPLFLAAADIRFGKEHSRRTAAIPVPLRLISSRRRPLDRYRRNRRWCLGLPYEQSYRSSGMNVMNGEHLQGTT